MSGFHKILVATDFSDTAARALEQALQLPRAENGTLTLFHVHEVPPAYPHATATWATIVRDAEDAARAELTRLQERAARRAEQDGRYGGLPELVTKMVTGGACVEILEEARRGGYDLVVIGTHGRTGLQRMLLGSVAERVVRMAPCPVLTVRPEGRDTRAADRAAIDAR